MKSGLICIPDQTNPGDGVLLDHSQQCFCGLIPLMSVFLNSQRFWVCTTFMDHVSDYIYVHLMRDLSLSETLLAKEALEKLMAQAGQTVKHYPSDNGRFSDDVFIDAINQKYQKITFCRVGAHHHNGIV